MGAAGSFLNALWGHALPGKIHLWSLATKRSVWISSTPEADNVDLSNGNWYVGACAGSKKKKFSASERLVETAAAWLPGLWLDLDFQTEYRKKKNLPPDEESCREIVRSLGVKPTLIVHTGGGLQPWWIFEHPFEITDANRDACKSLVQDWQTYIRDSTEYEIDSTHDLARLMRLPGSNNVKHDPPIPVSFTDEGQRRDAAWWFTHVEQLGVRGAHGEGARDSTKQANNVAQGAAGRGRAPRINLDPKPNTRLLRSLIRKDPVFEAAWDRNSKIDDSSPSGYDMAIAKRAIILGVEAQKVADLLVLNRKEHNLEVKPHALEKTLERAMLDAPITTDDITNGKRSLWDILRIDEPAMIYEVRDSPEDPARATYRLETAKGPIELGGIDTIMTHRKFKNIVAERQKRVIRNIPKGGWEDVAEQLINPPYCEVVYPGDEKHPRTSKEVEETREWINAHYRDDGVHKISSGFDTATEEIFTDVIAKHETFTRRGVLFIHKHTFRDWLFSTYQLRLGPKEVVQRMTDAGMGKKRVKSPVGTRVWFMYVKEQAVDKWD